jgi:hypothetical protein
VRMKTIHPIVLEDDHILSFDTERHALRTLMLGRTLCVIQGDS